MIEHVSVPVRSVADSSSFYASALQPLGYALFSDYAPDAAGFAEGGTTSIWLVRKDDVALPIHVALRADSKDAVQAFYEQALSAGGKDNGGPGFREEYGPNYYAAFVLDPDGNNIEACYFGETKE